MTVEWVKTCQDRTSDARAEIEMQQEFAFNIFNLCQPLATLDILSIRVTQLIQCHLRCIHHYHLQSPQ